MAKVTQPNDLTKFPSLTQDISTTVSTALWKRVAQIQEYLNASVPVGKVIFFRSAQPLIPDPVPDARYWKELDGTAVSNPDSPLDGWVTPDLRTILLKHPADSEANQTLSGLNTRSFTHDHGGLTGSNDGFGEYVADDNDEVPGPTYHTHSIGTATIVTSIVPPVFDLRFFVRIV